MTINELSKVVALVITAVACVMAAVYALTNQIRATKKPLRIFESIVFLYLVVIYTSALTGNTDPLFLSGVYTRTAVIALTGLCVGEIIIDWRRH